METLHSYVRAIGPPQWILHLAQSSTTSSTGEGITRLEHVFVSHADHDHLGGVMRLLGDPAISIGTIWVNPDPSKAGPTWERFRTTVYMTLLRIVVSKMEASSSTLLSLVRAGDLTLEVLHPDLDWALAGVNSKATGAGSNTMSAVIRITLFGIPAILLAADISEQSLQRLIQRDCEMKASVLVFPHHGGRPGDDTDDTDTESFAYGVTERVQPEFVIFSLSRTKYHNPQPFTMLGVRTCAPLVSIRCTQLSRWCASEDKRRPTDHLASTVAAGRPSGSCCSGSVTIRVAPDGALTLDPPTTRHAAFVSDQATYPLCSLPLSSLEDRFRPKA